MNTKSTNNGDTYMRHHSHYSNANGKDDDPCDDWSGVPIPKPKKETV